MVCKPTWKSCFQLYSALCCKVNLMVHFQYHFLKEVGTHSRFDFSKYAPLTENLKFMVRSECTELFLLWFNF